MLEVGKIYIFYYEESEATKYIFIPISQVADQNFKCMVLFDNDASMKPDLAGSYRIIGSSNSAGGTAYHIFNNAKEL